MIGCDRPIHLCDCLDCDDHWYYFPGDLLSSNILDNGYVTLMIFNDDLAWWFLSSIWMDIIYLVE